MSLSSFSEAQATMLLPKTLVPKAGQISFRFTERIEGESNSRPLGTPQGHGCRGWVAPAGSCLVWIALARGQNKRLAVAAV